MYMYMYSTNYMYIHIHVHIHVHVDLHVYMYLLGNDMQYVSIGHKLLTQYIHVHVPIYYAHVHVATSHSPAVEDSRSLGSLTLSLDSAQVSERGPGILWHSVVWPRRELQVEHLLALTTQLHECACVCMCVHVNVCVRVCVCVCVCM